MNSRRVRILQCGPQKKGPVSYWMSRDQRSRDNWALLYAQKKALESQVPLLVVFCLIPHYLSADSLQYAFLLQGLQEVAEDLAPKNIPFSVLSGEPSGTMPRYIRDNDLSLLVTDFDPLHIKQKWKQDLLQKTDVAIHEVDAHNIVPCWEASPRQEFGAYTLRPKLHRQLSEYLDPFPSVARHPYIIEKSPPGADWKLQRSRHVQALPPSETRQAPGQSAALKELNDFITHGIESYADLRNDPSQKGQSELSPYIHFGHLSAQKVTMAIHTATSSGPSQASFLEELIVRRELADNFCYYNPNYDNIKGFPAWAQETLEKHLYDIRPYQYDRDSLESANTHDPAWNAAQRQLLTTGKMHGYMRMYWAKKILEWSTDPETAMKAAIYLNDHYSLDGRDPNGYAGIAWSIGGVHDRAWGERPVFGKIRYMNYAGLRRKFDINRYIKIYDSRSIGVSEQPS